VILVWVLDRQVADDVDPRIYRSRPRAVAGLVAWVVAIWIVGVGVAAGVRTFYSAAGGVSAAFVVAVVISLLGIAMIYPYALRVSQPFHRWIERRRVRRRRRTTSLSPRSELDAWPTDSMSST
jgi:hypothetical protein